MSSRPYATGAFQNSSILPIMTLSPRRSPLWEAPIAPWVVASGEVFDIRQTIRQNCRHLRDGLEVKRPALKNEIEKRSNQVMPKSSGSAVAEWASVPGVVPRLSPLIPAFFIVVGLNRA